MFYICLRSFGRKGYNLIREDIYQELYLAITELPKNYREIFWLYLQGKNSKEIAEILSLSEKDVRTCKKEAICRLKSRLGGLFFWLQIMRIVWEERTKSS